MGYFKAIKLEYLNSNHLKVLNNLELLEFLFSKLDRGSNY